MIKNLKFLNIVFFKLKISLYVKGIKIIQTKSHLKNARVNGDMFSIDANLPILKLPAQNKVAKTTIK